MIYGKIQQATLDYKSNGLFITLYYDFS